MKNTCDNQGVNKPDQKEMERLHALLELEGMSGTDPDGFVTVVLYIEGDVRSQRLVCLN